MNKNTTLSDLNCETLERKFQELIYKVYDKGGCTPEAYAVSVLAALTAATGRMYDVAPDGEIVIECEPRLEFITSQQAKANGAPF